MDTKTLGIRVSEGLALSGMAFLNRQSWEMGHEGSHHNFAVIASMIIKFGTGIKLDVSATQW